MSYRPLAGVTLIEASSFIASPSAGLYLAQLGARVIRVDQIGGGPDFRRWPLAQNGSSLYWENLNRGKESIALDLSGAEGRDLLVRLVRASGILLTNYPVDGFLSHDRLRGGRDDLITLRVMGRADGGSALDYTVNAAVGYPLQTGEGPGPVNHVLPAWDLLTGAYAAFALLAALRHRDATGEGGEVRVPLEDVAMGSAANIGSIAEVLLRGADRPRYGNSVYGAFGRDFLTADGERIMLMAMTPRQWSALIDVLDLREAVAAIETERGVNFARDEGVRFEHRDALYPLVEAAVARRQCDELTRALDAAGGCHGRYQTMLDAARDTRLVGDNPLFAPASNPSGEHYRAASAFAAKPDAPRQPPLPAPELGRDSRRVLSDLLKLEPAETDELIARGVVGDA